MYSFELSTGNANGFSVKGRLFCTTCNESIDEDYLCQRVGGAKLTRAPFEIKGRATLAFRGIGCGLSGMNDWCCVLPNLSEMRLKTLVFYQIRMEFLKLLCI